MNVDIFSITNIIVTNGIIAWVAIWVVRKIDKLDERVEKHETRLSVAEKEIEYVHKHK